MEITLIICITIAVCVYTICHFINNIYKKQLDNEDIVNTMSNDIDAIRNIISKTKEIEFYDSTAKNNINIIYNILEKYNEDSAVDTSTKES